MARSRMKVPCLHHNTRGEKRQANKKVRRTPDIDSGGAYKRVYESWDIRDYTMTALRRFRSRVHHRSYWTPENIAKAARK